MNLSPSLITRRSAPSRYDQLVRSGAAIPLLPGIARRCDVEDSLLLRTRAVILRHPSVIIRGETAAALTWWPELSTQHVHASGARGRGPAWLHLDERTVDPELVRPFGRALTASPALSVLDLVPTMGTAPLFESLRRRITTIEKLRSAAETLQYRRGRRALLRLLHQTRKGPWSPLELEGHRRLHDAGVMGWRANHRVRLSGQVLYVDIAFPELKIAIELDGLLHHSSAADLDRDHRRQNLLMLAGWQVLRFSWSTVDEIVPVTRRALARRGRNEML